ncbi:AAA family ATPase [Budviciaceae bacterium CWB-B4]|uniref:AAA family ATPase n=1 Tax=Limnobaculum xujianqingii TaxID=2738837 RepID=A0A9D7FQC6_9GAMM|nr:ATP-binding protein [Limnobaculum xujianqingii]MBK5071550.1 AAA family ATPase [Limnobaculum xujianqingii]MBK5174859.1 AAA family ATPase [Limnobaculum xujianqingii]
MAKVRQLEIKNFRSIKNLIWNPSSGMNCLIGHGDAGKSTILDSLDIALGSRRSYPFSDADFYCMDTTHPIEIYVTLGELDEQLKSIELYGHFLRSYSPITQVIYDEPAVGNETVITIKLSIQEDLEPEWLLFSQRALSSGIERRLQWSHRELISPSRLGATSTYHLAWGHRSILNKLSEESLNVSANLSNVARQARALFAQNQPQDITRVLDQVSAVATKMGVPIKNLQAHLDVNSVSLSNGAIALHNEDNTPLKQLGTGSTRLLISGLQKAASKSSILIIDEAEYGLEPYRITRLLNELGSKESNPDKQVFLTTHSPYVLRELSANQLNVVRLLNDDHKIYNLGNGDTEQATLRACAEAFLSKDVLVCEGKTEIGLMRGFDLFLQSKNKDLFSSGLFCADGGGDSMFERANVFARLGYKTAIFKDSDKSSEHSKLQKEAENNGITIFEWGNNHATENILFSSLSKDLIIKLLNYAIERKGRDAISSHILTLSNNTLNLDQCLNNFTNEMRTTLGSISKKKGWYKDIEPAEYIMREIIAPNYTDISQELTATINNLYIWIKTNKKDMI